MEDIFVIWEVCYGKVKGINDNLKSLGDTNNIIPKQMLVFYQATAYFVCYRFHNKFIGKNGIR